MLRLVWLFILIYFQFLIMASSEVGIASSASPFGCVLRDHNWRDRINRNNRENVENSFETKIKYFVQDHHHLNANISESTPPNHPQNQENDTFSNETKQDRRKRDVSPTLSDDSSIETKTPGCVSSLVKKWRDFGNTRHITEKTSNSNSDPLEKLNYLRESVEESTSNENFGTPCSERFDTPTMAIGDDVFVEDGEERERLRVADVIRKLRLENETIGNCNEIKLKEQEKTPRIRGRQAFKDLLMQLEQDRHVELDRLVERRAVSKFSHRGRIQSVLRLRFLRRDAIVRQHHQQRQQQQSKAIGTHQQSHSTPKPAPAPQQSTSFEESTIIHHPKTSLTSNPTIIKTREHEAIAMKREQAVSKSIKEQRSNCEAVPVDEQLPDPLPCQHNQMGQGSKVVLLREKFDVLDKADTTTPRASKGIAKTYSLCIRTSSTNKLGEELIQQQEVTNTTPNSTSKASDKVSTPTSDPSREVRDSDFDNNFSLESEKFAITSTSCSLQQDANHEADNSCSSKLRKVSILANVSELSNINNLQQEVNNEVDKFYTPPCEKTMASLDEDHQNKYNQEPSGQLLESGEEWRNDDIQYWNEWDEEDVSNLDWVSDIARPKSDWENLRQARYREMLDSDEENNEMRKLLERKSVSTFLTSNMRDKMDQLMISRVERVPQSMERRLDHYVIPSIQTQPNVEKEEEKEERDSNFSDEVKYLSLEQPHSSKSSCPENQPFSALTNRSSIDPDYMYDIRVYMEQLHQEIAELRKTVNRCIDMQEKMQRSIKQEVSVAVDLSVGRAMQGPANNTTGTRNCCLCYEMQVDSLLYRCGHMCTCFKCAHELQWSTGKCPICQAPILDVVRAYPDANFIYRR